MSKTRRRVPRVGRTPDLLRKSHVHPRRYAEPEVDLMEVDEALQERVNYCSRNAARRRAERE